MGIANNIPPEVKDPADVEDFDDYFTDDYYLIAEFSERPHVTKELDTEDKNFEQE